jgi:predicted transcriptional regulator
MKDMIGVRLPKEIKNVIEELAEKENRSISNYVYTALLTFLRDHADVDVDMLLGKKSSGKK